MIQDDAGQLFGVAKLFHFIFPNAKAPIQESAVRVPGTHSSERDARATLKIYYKLVTMEEAPLLRRNGQIVRELINAGKTIKDFREMIKNGLIAKPTERVEDRGWGQRSFRPG